MDMLFPDLSPTVLIGIKTDPEKANALFALAVKLDGTDKTSSLVADEKLAADLYYEAATLGHREAMFNRACCFITDRFLHDDELKQYAPTDAEIKEAFYWLQHSAARGLPNAYALLGIMYEKGLGIGFSHPAAALECYTRSAAMGYQAASLLRDRLQERGAGLEKRIEAALIKTLPERPDALPNAWALPPTQKVKVA